MESVILITVLASYCYFILGFGTLSLWRRATGDKSFGVIVIMLWPITLILSSLRG